MTLLRFQVRDHSPFLEFAHWSMRCSQSFETSQRRTERLLRGLAEEAHAWSDELPQCPQTHPEMDKSMVN